MRVAYITPYQGPDLLRRRPIIQNLSLAANVKMELICELLQRGMHNVEVLSQGEVVERQLRFYSAFAESKQFHADVPVYYSSSLPIRFVNGFWSNYWMLKLFKRRHRSSPFDLVMIYNLKRPQVACANYALNRLGLPVIVEYEDDAFVDIEGKAERGLKSTIYLASAKRILDEGSGGVGVSPHLLSRMPATIPKLLLRGVVDEDIVKASRQPVSARKNWVVYSGTHYRTKGLEPLIAAWGLLDVPGWELHIAGRGELTSRLERLAENNKTIVFHGVLNRQENARLLSAAKIGINPHDVSKTPGNVFAFKIIEYLAAGAHCITTPMGALESELESGVTYISDNSPATVAAALKDVIDNRRYERVAAEAALKAYGPETVAQSLDGLLRQVMATRRRGERRLPAGSAS